jgi:hypothetical protein
LRVWMAASGFSPLYHIRDWSFGARALAREPGIHNRRSGMLDKPVATDSAFARERATE